MDHCSNSYVNSAHSYFTLKNYNKVIPGLIVGPPEPANTPSMNPQIVLSHKPRHNPYDSLTYDSTPGNYYTVSTGQYGSATCEANIPRQCKGTHKHVISGPPRKGPGSKCTTGTLNPCGKGLECVSNNRGLPGGQGICRDTVAPFGIAVGGNKDKGWPICEQDGGAHTHVPRYPHAEN